MANVEIKMGHVSDVIMRFYTKPHREHYSLSQNYRRMFGFDMHDQHRALLHMAFNMYKRGSIAINFDATESPQRSSAFETMNN